MGSTWPTTGKTSQTHTQDDLKICSCCPCCVPCSCPGLHRCPNSGDRRESGWRRGGSSWSWLRQDRSGLRCRWMLCWIQVLEHLRGAQVLPNQGRPRQHDPGRLRRLREVYRQVYRPVHQLIHPGECGTARPSTNINVVGWFI